MNVLDHIYTEFVDYAPHPHLASNEYEHLLSSYSNVTEQLMITLSSEQKKLFLELESQRNLLAAADEENMFVFGFKTGIRLLIESLFQTNL